MNPSPGPASVQGLFGSQTMARRSGRTSAWRSASWIKRPPGDRAVAGIAVAALAGARGDWSFISRPLPLFIVLGCALVLSLVLPGDARPFTIVASVVLFLGCSLLADRAERGLRLPLELRRQNSFDVALLTDPTLEKAGVSVDVRVSGKRLQLRASGSPAQTVAGLSAGHRLRVRGRLRALDSPVNPWLLSRHISGRLTATAILRVDAEGQTPGLYRIADSIRSVLLRSGSVLPRSQRGLFAGFLLGDDRDQPPELIDDFRASGLSHLLVVSGQNVAFTLAVFEPAMRRLRRRPRLITTIGVLVVFATVTRFEPSVLRAVWMAGVVAIARCLGRPQKGLRVLSMAVIVLVVIDPLLSYSVGFALSVAATAGLAVWSDPLTRRLPLPERIRSVVAPTLAAQGGASVIMIPAFGSVPVVSLLANIVVVPVAAPLMGWGVAAGLPAGLLGRFASRLVHAPTTVIIGFVAWSARSAARLPLGSVGLVPTFLFGFVTWLTCRSTADHRGRWWGAALAGLMVWPTITALATRAPVRSGWTIERGARVWTVSSAPGILGTVTRSAHVVVLTSDVDVGRLLAALRADRYSSIEALVVANGGRGQSAVVRALASRVSIGLVVVGDPAMTGGVKPSVRVARPVQSMIGDLRVRVVPVGGGRLDVQVARLP